MSAPRFLHRSEKRHFEPQMRAAALACHGEINPRFRKRTGYKQAGIHVCKQFTGYFKTQLSHLLTGARDSVRALTKPCVARADDLIAAAVLMARSSELLLA
ncbi:uncharacterized protein V6R79_024043 [Siganus canaliculatus]